MKLKYFLIIPLFFAVCALHPDVMDGINQVFETYQWLVLILSLAYSIILVTGIVLYCNPFDFNGYQRARGRDFKDDSFWIEMDTFNLFSTSILFFFVIITSRSKRSNTRRFQFMNTMKL